MYIQQMYNITFAGTHIDITYSNVRKVCNELKSCNCCRTLRVGCDCRKKVLGLEALIVPSNIVRRTGLDLHVEKTLNTRSI